VISKVYEQAWRGVPLGMSLCDDRKTPDCVSAVPGFPGVSTVYRVPRCVQVSRVLRCVRRLRFSGVSYVSRLPRCVRRTRFPSVPPYPGSLVCPQHPGFPKGVRRTRAPRCVRRTRSHRCVCQTHRARIISPLPLRVAKILAKPKQFRTCSATAPM
jgi:hypothetical protein